MTSGLPQVHCSTHQQSAVYSPSATMRAMSKAILSHHRKGRQMPNPFLKLGPLVRKSELLSRSFMGIWVMFVAFCGMSLAPMNRLLLYSFRQIGLALWIWRTMKVRDAIKKVDPSLPRR